MRCLSPLAVLLLLPACRSNDGAGAPAATPPPAVAAPARAPLAPQAAAPAAPAAAAASVEPRWSAQEGWLAEPPTSAMRKAQFRLPGVEGAGEATLVVYHFGAGGGGGVEANVARWASQFEAPDGSEPVPHTGARTLKGVAVTDVDLSGTYVAETSPGSGERVREEGWRLLAAILEPPGGPYYVKLVGPAATVAQHEARYRAFLAAALP